MLSPGAHLSLLSHFPFFPLTPFWGALGAPVLTSAPGRVDLSQGRLVETESALVVYFLQTPKCRSSFSNAYPVCYKMRQN